MLKVNDIAQSLGISAERVRQILKENPHYKVIKNNSGVIRIPPKTIRALLEHRGKTFRPIFVTIGIQKGGCGKTLLTINGGICLARHGRKVLIIDLDPEAHITHFFLSQEVLNKSMKTADVFQNKVNFDEAICKTHYESLDIVPGDKETRKLDKLIGSSNPAKIISNKIKNIRKKYDVVFFDVSSWYARVTESAYITSDLVIIPTLPDANSIESVGTTIEDIEESCTEFDCQLPIIKALMNKYENEGIISSDDGWKTLTSEHRGIVLPFQIKDAKAFQNASNKGLSIFENKAPKIAKENIVDLANVISPLIDV